MEIFDLPKKDQMSKDEIEILDKKQHEYKLIGQQRKRAGHTMFSFNIRTGEIKTAPVKHCKDVDFATANPATRDSLVIEKDCVYRQALNKKNFIKILVREGFLKRVKHGDNH